MHKISIGFVVMALLSSPAYAGWTISEGIVNHGVNEENFAKAMEANVANTEITTNDDYSSYGYLWDNGIDLSYSKLGSVTYTDNTRPAHDDAYSTYSRGSLVEGIDISYVHAIGLDNGTRLRLRGGYNWDFSLAEDSTVLLFGVGLAFKNIFIEYKFYDISDYQYGALIPSEGGGNEMYEMHEVYSGASVIAVGLQF